MLILLVATGVATTLMRFQDCPDLFRHLYHAVVLRDPDFIDRQVRFRSRMAGTTMLANGLTGDFTIVRASDCVEVSSEVEEKGSAVEARNELEKMTREAFRLIERGSKIDRSGQKVGERVLLLSERGGKAEVVVWFNGDSKLFKIESNSLSHVLAYEKLIQNGYSLDPHGYVIPR